MAPSATAELATSLSKVEISKQPEKHVHGAEDKTPLEAISHGPLIHPGMDRPVLLYFFSITQKSICSVFEYVDPPSATAHHYSSFCILCFHFLSSSRSHLKPSTLFHIFSPYCFRCAIDAFPTPIRHRKTSYFPYACIPDIFFPSDTQFSTTRDPHILKPRRAPAAHPHTHRCRLPRFLTERLQRGHERTHLGPRSRVSRIHLDEPTREALRPDDCGRSDLPGRQYGESGWRKQGKLLYSYISLIY